MLQYTQIVFYLLLMAPVCGQNWTSNRMIHRISLNERANIYLQDISILLLEEFCNDQLTAYMMSDRLVEIDSIHFYSKKNLAQDTDTKQASIKMRCDQLYTNEIYPVLHFLDFMEEVTFDVQQSTMKRKVLFVRLVYESQGVIYEGPIFLFDDILGNANIYSTNPQNGLKMNVGQIFDYRLFTSRILQDKNNRYTVEDQNCIDHSYVRWESHLWVVDF